MRYSIFLFTVYCLTVFSMKSQAQQKDQDSSAPQTSTRVLDHLPPNLQPVIGAWFWNNEDFNPDGYKYFIDQVNEHS